MNKIIIIVLTFFFISNCSFNSNSKFWTKEREIRVEKDSKITEIFEKEKIFEKELNPNLKITYKPLPKDDPLQRKPDISLAESELSWKPKIYIDEGLEKTIPWFKERV